MKKATINIELIANDSEVSTEVSMKGEAYLVMKGLTDAIKQLEETVPEDSLHRSVFRTKILEMLNGKD